MHMMPCYVLVLVTLGVLQYTYKHYQNLYYTDTFGFFDGDDTRAITIQREQYRGIVYLFIGNHKALCVITSMPSIITYKDYKMLQGQQYHHLHSST